ncbi:aldo/keto reductase [Jannaschia aquimarina]|uniref:YhdN_2 protein n=1 Tax=Jannaschia aquimarina TaxID=935700 RepID=A0A0D1EDW7_9RHOB|nr:aldo/keto reductase [Jannaschia aquimarina]KIT15879.1 General stress protein 69 [Jannaschia aquimarina]SNS96875.1 Predicted oxidoreductase [Jannaschia aquimarina]
MRTVPLGQSDTISEIMLGTMTFGTQTSEADARTQMSMAADAGVTWLDTAEIYPVNPMKTETAGLTEEICGRWLRDNPGRLRVATKHPGAGSVCRNGEPITAESIPRVIEGSLKRLGVETIDLYQFHWPNRGSFQFRQYWTYRPKGERAEILDDMAACADALEREVARGTIRAFGPSNESSWGLSQWCELADVLTGATRPVSIQNEYSLLCRIADTDLAETMAYEQITMLAFSPLATGLITGKYQDGAIPDGSRRSISPELGGRWGPRVEPAVAAYLDLAAQHGVDPVHMALAWLQTRPFNCSAILGATTVAQLEHGLKAQDMTLPDELVAAIDDVHKAHPMPY